MNAATRAQRGGTMADSKNVVTSTKNGNFAKPIPGTGTSPKQVKQEPKNVVTSSKEG